MSQEQTKGQSPLSSFWFIASAALILVIVVAGIVVVLVPKGTAGEPQPTGTNTAEPAVIPVGSDSVCGLEPGDQTVPSVKAPIADWVLVGKIAVPTEPETAGPGTIDSDGFRSCYAHSPTGALFATMNFYAQGSSPELAIRTYEELLAPGAGRDAALAAAAEAPTSQSTASVQFAGYTILEYSDEAATIDVLARSSTGAVLSLITDLVWVDGDWKALLQDRGEPRVSPRQITDISGYIPWSGA